MECCRPSLRMIGSGVDELDDFEDAKREFLLRKREDHV